MSLAEVWSNLQNDSREGAVVRRRIDPKGQIPLYACFNLLGRPGRSLVLDIRSSEAIKGTKLPEGKGFSIELKALDLGKGLTTGLIVSAVDQGCDDLFCAMSEDVVTLIQGEETTEGAAGALLNRIAAWQEFMSRSREGIPSLAETIGLLGELLLIQDVCIPVLGPERSLSCWVGPRGGAKDFVFGKLGLEVKTTRNAEAGMVTISSLAQLSTEGFAGLYLVHQKLEQSEHDGWSLIDLIRTIRIELDAFSALKAHFDNLILSMGWSEEALDHDRGQSKWTLSRRSYFEVANGFPRLVRPHVGPEIGDFAYPILLRACLPFLVESKIVESRIRGASVGDYRDE